MRGKTDTKNEQHPLRSPMCKLEAVFQQYRQYWTKTLPAKSNERQFIIGAKS